MTWSQENIYRIYTKVTQKATTDEEFRQDLLENPQSAIKQLTGKTLPDNYKIRILEKDPNYDAMFVLPKLSADELNLDDLDNVAGGLASECRVQVETICGVVDGSGEIQHKNVSPMNSNR